MIALSHVLLVFAVSDVDPSSQHVSAPTSDTPAPIRGPAANAGELLGLFGLDSTAFKLGAYGEVFVTVHALSSSRCARTDESARTV